MKDPKVELLGCPENPQTMTVAAALGCFEERSSSEIMKELLSLPKEERLKKERAVLKNSFGRGHGSVGDLVHFTFGIEDLSRVSTLFLCSPEYPEHLQQSLRRADANRGFHLPEAIKDSRLANETEKSLNKTFDFYNRARAAGIPAEDARFVLPLCTKTNITTTINARELCHLYLMSKRFGIPSEAARLVEKMVTLAGDKTPYLFKDLGFNYEPLSWYPSAQLFNSLNLSLNEILEQIWDLRGRGGRTVFMLGYLQPYFVTEWSMQRAVSNKVEAELANLKHVHFEFMLSMSLACFHQAVRQRTWNHSVEGIYGAVEDALQNPESRTVVPPSVVKSEMLNEYKKVHHSLIELYEKLTKAGIPSSEAIGVIPHSLKIHDLVHINGWNAVHSIGKRTCREAQWEIRIIARKMATLMKEKLPALGKYAEPQCVTYKQCPETNDCGYLEKRLFKN